MWHLFISCGGCYTSCCKPDLVPHHVIKREFIGINVEVTPLYQVVFWVVNPMVCVTLVLSLRLGGVGLGEGIMLQIWFSPTSPRGSMWETCEGQSHSIKPVFLGCGSRLCATQVKTNDLDQLNCFHWPTRLVSLLRLYLAPWKDNRGTIKYICFSSLLILFLVFVTSSSSSSPPNPLFLLWRSWMWW